MKKSVVSAVVLGLVLAALGAGYLLVRDSAPAPMVSTGPAAEPAGASAAPDPAPASASGPARQAPVSAAEPAASGSAAGVASDAESVLSSLFGRKSTLGMFQLDDFARRIAATVDNLGRSHAPAQLWPVNPADGRFLTERQGEAEVIGADNGLRYTPFVLLLETVDLHQVAAAYAQLYPQFQTAYEALGYPGRSFNDRVLVVLDLLIATPDVQGPVKVRRPVINGPVQPSRPWVLYEFEDPALQSLSAGQKILLRTGPVNQRRLEARLIELRRLLANGTPAR